MRKFSSLVLAVIGFLVAAPLAAQTAAPGTSPSKPATSAAPSAPAKAAPAAAASAELVDLNSATKEQLDALPGIGSVRAEAIIKGRPYRGKDELLRKKILPQTVYDGIKEKVVARQKS